MHFAIVCRHERRPRVGRLAPGIVRMVSITFIPSVPPPACELKSAPAAYPLAERMAKASDWQLPQWAGALPFRCNRLSWLERTSLVDTRWPCDSLTGCT